VDGSGSRSYPVGGCGINGVEPLGFATTVLVTFFTKFVCSVYFYDLENFKHDLHVAIIKNCFIGMCEYAICVVSHVFHVFIMSHKDVWGTEVTARRILNLSTRWR
jgi:hypothetical protein